METSTSVLAVSPGPRLPSGAEREWAGYSMAPTGLGGSLPTQNKSLFSNTGTHSGIVVMDIWGQESFFLWLIISFLSLSDRVSHSRS